MNRYYGKGDEIYGSETLHREIGYYISRLEKYDDSLKFFDKAIEKTPEDIRALVGRSRARAQAIENEGALEDINRALSVDPDNLEVLGDKALNTYLCCEFEEALVQNTRLLPIRRQPDMFKMGVMRCTDAIENCVGERAGRPLRDHFKIIRKLAWKRNHDAHKPYEPTPTNKPKKKMHRFVQRLKPEEDLEPVVPRRMMRARKKGLPIYTPSGHVLEIKDSLHSINNDECIVPPCKPPFPFNPLQKHTTNIENYMAERYLDVMYEDKIFLRELKGDPGLNSPNRAGALKLKHIVSHGYKTVCHKQEILRARRPFYFIKYQQDSGSGALKARQQLELEHQRLMIKKEADLILAKMIAAYKEKRLKDFLMISEKMKRFCDSKPKKTFPLKASYMSVLYDTVCKAFYDVYRSNQQQSMYEQNKRIYAILGIPLSREPSTDSVITQFKYMFLDYKKQIKLFEERLQNATLPEEVCWFYHELARYHLEQKRFELSRVYARKCIQEAALMKNDRWIVNGSMLMCKGNVQQQNKADAKSDLLQAMRSAERLKDKAKVAYLKQCLEVVNTIELDDVFGAKELQKREHKIIQMMKDQKMKDEVSHLFRQMSAMPPTRRMTVIPGIKVEFKERKSKGRNMSIMPGMRGDHDEIISEMRRSVTSKGSRGSKKSLIDFISL